MERDSRGRFRPEEPFVKKPESPLPETWEDYMGRMQTIQELRNPLDVWKDSVDIKINTGATPYFFMGNLSDTHIGAEGVDYEYVQKYHDFIEDTDIQYATYGDMGDFFSPKILAEAMMDTVANPDEQLASLRAYYEKYSPHLLYSVGGNHDDWVRKTSGIEPYRWLTKDLDVPLLNNGGAINLDVNGIKYKGLVYHKIAKYGSSFNQTHAGKQMLRMAQDADFVVSGHTHIFGAEKAQLRDKKVTVVQLGTPKVEDKFGKRGMSLGAKPQKGFPTLFFSGLKKNIEMIEDIDEAQEHIYGLRALYGEKVEQGRVSE